ncbi:MAG: phage tail tape measure protein, partial [Bacteroidales bacterium]|nr:phage tail tape measure protein [Bacteroidales bacterium]
MVVDVDYQPTYEKFKETLTKIADAVEKELPKIKLDFDSKSVKEAESGTKNVSDAVKEIGKAAKEASSQIGDVSDVAKKVGDSVKDVSSSVSNAAKGASEDIKTLADDATKLNKSSIRISKQLATLYEQRRKFSGASVGSEESKEAYSDIEKAIKSFEQLKNDLRYMTEEGFINRFTEIEKGSSGALEALSKLDEKTKLLSKDVKEYNDALKQVTNLRSTIEKNSARWTASQSGTTSAEYNAYSALAGDGAGSTGELIKKLETGEMKMNDFAKAFSEVNAKASEYSRIISKAGENTKVASNSLLVRGTDEYNAALDKIKSRLADVKRYTEAWTAAREGKSSEAYAELTKQADALYALNSRLSEGTVYNNEYKETMAGITTVIGESVIKIREVNEDMKASSPSELTEGTRAYSNALKDVESLSRTIQKNSEAWTKAESGNAKEAYATYKNLGTELDTLYKCIETGQLTREEFEEWFARIGTTATDSARAIRKAGEDMKLDKTLAQGTKEYNDALAKANKLLTEVTNNTKKWSKASDGKSKAAYDTYRSQAKSLTELIDKLKTGTMTEEEFKEQVEQVRTVMKDSEATIRANGDAVSKFGGVLVEVGMKLYYYYFGLQKMIQLAKKMISTSIEVESAMNRLQIVTGATDYEMKTFFSAAAEQAKELGKNIVDVASSIETFSRLGYTLSESSTLSKFATIMSNIADTDVSKATTGLTSIIKGYKLDVSNVEHVTDVLVQVGKKYAISAEELMEAFERGGAALNASGTSFEKSAALFAATNASLQNAANVGTLWKTVSARIRGSKTELEELGESYDDLADGFSKYRDEILALSGVDIMVDKNHFKDIYDIFVELAQVWDKIDSDTAKARISEILGGTRQLSGIASTINNISDAIGAYNDAVADETAGVALKANEKYMETTAAHIEQLKTSFQELSYDAFNSDFLKFFVDRLKDIVEAIDWLTKHIGTLGTVLLGLSAVKFFKNFGNLREVVKYMGLLKGVTAEASRGFSSLASAIGISSATLGAFIAVAGGIFVIVKIIDALTESYEEAKEKYESAKQNLESTQEEISNVNSELENTKKRLQELEGKHLTAVEQAEYNRLVLYNEQLERQKQILSDNEKIQKNALAVAANNALTNNGFRVYDKEIAARANETNKSLNGYDARALRQFNPYRSGDIIEMIEGETEEIKALEAAGEENSNRYSELISSRAKHISEAIEYSNNLIGSDGEVLDEYKKTWERLFNALDNTKSDEQKAEEKAKKQTDTIKSILEKYTGLAKTIKQLVRD